MNGQHVCQTHGGRAPLAMLSAQERLAQMVDPALTALRKLVDEADADSVRLSAIKDILDRHMGRAKQAIDLTTAGQPLIKSVSAADLALINPE